MSLRRRLRGAAVMASLWAAAWLLPGIGLGLALRWIRVPVTGFGEIAFLVFWTGIGFLSGAAFAALLATRERNRTVDELSSPRIVVLGVLAGATFPVLSTLLALAVTNLQLRAVASPVFLGMAALGGGCAGATLWLARRGTEKAQGIAPTA